MLLAFFIAAIYGFGVWFIATFPPVRLLCLLRPELFALLPSWQRHTSFSARRDPTKPLTQRMFRCSTWISWTPRLVRSPAETSTQEHRCSHLCTLYISAGIPRVWSLSLQFETRCTPISARVADRWWGWVRFKQRRATGERRGVPRRE